MADKSVGELIAAQSVTPTDLFVLEQNGTVKKLTGQILENWLVSLADGHGGIQSIVKKSTSGLVDTYRITLADTTPFDFMVTNGKSIKSISKESTSGLVDTYRIAFNDGTSSTFAVTNGEKGDKGDNQYVWIKYASQKPTATSHSFGDVADDWIGIYSGSSDTAPTDWTQYEWFKIKGEKGDTGSPATLVGSVTEYLASDSGTIVPSGSWTVTVPAVAQGKYLWTRVTQTYNTGSPVVSYSVSRIGMDGSGSVSSVNEVSPDSNGNVQLTPDDIGADTKKKYGKLVVFGDSLGQGVNNDNYSFADILSESGAFERVTKCCVGSATIGPYQVDSAAAGYSLIEQIETYSSDVSAADIIMLEYGANDVFAVLEGNVTMGTSDDTSATTTVCGYTKKALERIRALNADARIIWLTYAWNNFEYLRDNRDTNFADVELIFEITAMRLARPYLASVIPITEGLSASDITSDKMHPNTEGHKYIANKILHNMFASADFPRLFRPMYLTGDIATSRNLSLDGSFTYIYQLLSAGASVTITHAYNIDYPMVLYPHMYNAYYMVFNATTTTDGNKFANVSIIWYANSSIVVKTPVIAADIESGAGTFDATYVDTSKNNWCNYTKDKRIVTLDFQETMNLNAVGTWTSLLLATGFPAAASTASTIGIILSDGATELVQIHVDTSGNLNAYIMNTEVAGKTIRGSLIYIANE